MSPGAGRPQALSGLHDSRMERAGRRAAHRPLTGTHKLCEAGAVLKRPAFRAREHEARPGARCRRRAQRAGLPQSLVNGAESRESVIGASERAHARGGDVHVAGRRAAPRVKRRGIPEVRGPWLTLPSLTEAGATMDPTLMLPPATCISEQLERGQRRSPLSQSGPWS